MIQRKADNLKDIANGKEPELPLSQKDWDDVLKTIKEMPNLERFEGVESVPESSEQDIINSEPEKEVIYGNAFEDVSKKVKAKLNGETKVSTKKN